MNERRLFWACFIALIATAFGFIVRGMIMNDWAAEFNLSEVEKGKIFGAGLWPFAISIVLFSLVIDTVGYGRTMVFAFACHIVSAIVTISADGPQGFRYLYVGNLIAALGNGAVEAVINPVVATMFSRQKTKWLNILHAGWPGGLVIGGLLALAIGAMAPGWGDAVSPAAIWRSKVALVFAPTLLYGVLMLTCTFPLNERVVAGVGYRDMLREFGIVGAAIVVALIVLQLGEVFQNWTAGGQVAVGAVLVGAFGLYVMSLGRPLLIFLMLLMIPLATTELGIDSWITPLMEPEMKNLGFQAGWILVYTSFIMMVLRFFAGPIVHKLSPLGLLAVSSLLAALGLVALSKSTGIMILGAATIYALGKTFFWPTMLGIVSEQFPKGGALTLNATGGVGMLGVGVVGAVFLGYIQDSAIDRDLAERNPALHRLVVTEKSSVFGRVNAVDKDALENAGEAAKAEIDAIRISAQKRALATVAIFPTIMLVCYLGLFFYFKSIGGYKADVLAGHAAEDAEFTGGGVGPVEA